MREAAPSLTILYNIAAEIPLSPTATAKKKYIFVF